MDGQKELLGIWIAQNEGAKFWLGVITELSNRGVKDIFIACVDGLKGFPEAIESVFPKTQIQLCIVHMIRNSVKYVNWKDRKLICGDLKTIYTSATEQQAEIALDEFGKKWDGKYPTISQMWRNNWQRVIPFFDYPEDIRKVIYTTNAIESLNRSLRKVIKTKVHSQRRIDTENILHGSGKHIEKMDNADTDVERGDQPVRHQVRRKIRA